MLINRKSSFPLLYYYLRVCFFSLRFALLALCVCYSKTKIDYAKPSCVFAFACHMCLKDCGRPVDVVMHHHHHVRSMLLTPSLAAFIRLHCISRCEMMKTIDNNMGFHHSVRLKWRDIPLIHIYFMFHLLYGKLLFIFVWAAFERVFQCMFIAILLFILRAHI